MTGKPVVERLYRGSSVAQRRTERREQIITAAIHVYGERGYRNATVKAVCDEAGLTERYFYESFANSEALLVAAFTHVMRFLRDAMETAAADQPADRPDHGLARARAVLHAHFATLQAHPQPARVFLVEVAGVSAEIDAILHDALRQFADILALPGDGGPVGELTRIGIVGGVLQITLSWVAADYAQPVDVVVESALRLCRAALDPR